MGFGTLSQGGSLPTQLYNVVINLYDGSQCDQVLPDVKKNWTTQLCAGDLAGGKDTCQGTRSHLEIYPKASQEFDETSILNLKFI